MPSHRILDEADTDLARYRSVRDNHALALWIVGDGTSNVIFEHLDFIA